MHLTVDIQDPFSYSLNYIYIAIGVMVLPIIIWLIYKLIKKILGNKKKANEKTPGKEPEVKKIRIKDKIKIKNKYLSMLKKLSDDFSKEKIDERKLYTELSSLVRNYVYEMTDLEVHKYTLRDIRKMNLPGLEQLINDYYTPEFAMESHSNPVEAIENARGVIETWN